ncbi:ABC transporter substrate-binding protein [Cohnella lubricantis]|uniref:ABC transporter substrate-binding protein n=1 Tax=Cohnella lubricantis TaxID=2163172 RepID=A0A841TC73_9BACL|nr:ABC transporter substrate-binding protein [Cohnella lubricantis]MBB6678612.1 ABC transporter substrate-binding protein [Cohnella lubricantis]MBP2119229.1 putative ABC transport system substrate-binding protein [Cohnella lubricantis]
MKKRILAPLMLSIAMLAMAGCGKTDNSSSGASSSPSSSPSASASASAPASADKTYSIAISQILEHPSLDATRDGFIAALKDAGIEEGKNLKIDYNNAQNDMSNNTSIAQKIASEKYDVVLAIATPSAQAVVQNVKNSPILFAAVTDPLDAKVVTDLEHPGGNVSGASDTNPAAITQLMDFIASDFPNVKTVGVVINEGEPNAVIMTKQAEEALAAHDIKLVKAAVSNTSEVKQATESLIGKADAIYITLDNTVVGSADTIIQIANEKKIPFFSSDRDTVEKGAFATVGFKYYDHGYQVGQMAVEILKNGKNVGDLPVKMQEKLDLILNLKAAEAQGITVTDAMKSKVQDPDNNIIQ